MRSTDAETGKLVSAQEHYDRLIESGNDPVLDPPQLAAYMDGWDGEALMDALRLTPDCRVLEIGVGTGRLALKVLRAGCASFTGMDISRPTLRRAQEHLSGFAHASLMQGEFPKDAPAGPFDRIYSSLTFLHIRDKRAACRRIASLLAPGGICVLSLDREGSGLIDMGKWAVETFPDNAEQIASLLTECDLSVQPIRPLERAFLIVAERTQ